ncbi:MAG: hypothetical protein K0U54_06575 [Bacteroidetes bacterium]|nr:hypothetical protein [Bacteroidota bacterium]
MHRQYKTIIHERVDLARRKENNTVIGKMKSGWAVLGDDQRLKGYSLLLRDPIVDNLNAISIAERLQFLSDMTVLGDAIMEVLNPSIINYSILGNTDRALHAHIHPRYDNELPEKRKTIPFIYHVEKMPYIRFDYDKDKELIDKIRQKLINKDGLTE